MKKRFVAFLLVLIMVLGMLPVSAMAAGSSLVSAALYPDWDARKASGKNYPEASYSSYQVGNEYGTVVVAPGDTIVDEGKLYYWVSYMSAVGETTSFDGPYIESNSNSNAVDASVSVNADKDLIHQVIYNLVDNAVKFTNETGTIDFKVKTDSKKLTFTITNTGKGIPESELPYVFERFYKVDKSRSANKNSTGLGLYIVKTIVKAHGGSITAASRENQFTAFSVVLPLNN